MSRPVVFLAIAACIVLASAANEPQTFGKKGGGMLGGSGSSGGGGCGSGGCGGGMPYQGGYDCKGKINRISCFLDPAGFVRGLSYVNDYDGSSVAVCDASGPSSGEDLVLDPLENIVRVEACRGGRYGYTSVTFFTDDNQIWTCGQGDYAYKPSDYESWYGSYQTYGWTGMSRRNMLQNAPNAETAVQTGESDPDKFFKKNQGWSWESRCMTYESPKKAEWASCSGCSGWFMSGAASDAYGYVNTGYRSEYRGYSSYYKYNGASSASNTGAKSTRYFKDYATYQKVSASCTSGTCDYNPGYYYKQLFPLASLSGFCDADGKLYNLYAFCWNSHYVGPKPETKVPVRVLLDLEGSLDCSSPEVAGQEVDIFYEQMAELQASLIAANSALQGMKISVVNESITCNAPVPGSYNSTITASKVFLEAPPNMTLSEFKSNLDAVVPDQNANLCLTLPDSPCLPIVNELLVQGVQRSLKKIRNMMATRMARTQSKRATIVSVRRVRRAQKSKAHKTKAKKSRN